MTTALEQKKHAAAILKRLRKAYPDAGCELIFSNPLELAVAAILSHGRGAPRWGHSG